MFRRLANFFAFATCRHDFLPIDPKTECCFRCFKLRYPKVTP